MFEIYGFSSLYNLKIKNSFLELMKNNEGLSHSDQKDKSQQNQDQLISNKDFAISTNSYITNTYTYPPSELNSLRVYIIYITRFLLIGNTLLSTSALRAAQLSQNPISLLIFKFIEEILPPIQVFLVLLTVGIVGSLAYLKLCSMDPKVSNSKVIEVLQYGIQLSLHLNGFLLIFSITQNIALMAVAAVIAMYSAVHFQNYVIKTDFLYHSSITSNITFYAIIIVAYIFNSIAFSMGNLALLNLMVCSHSLALTVWYLSSGNMLYIYSSPKICLSILVSLSILCGFISAEDYFSQSNELLLSSMSKIALTLVCTLSTFKAMDDRILDRLIRRIKVISQEDIVDIQLTIKMLKNKLSPIEYELIIIGLIKRHQIETVDIHRCCIKDMKIYDSTSKSYISIEKLWFECELFFKFFLKEQFESFQLSKQTIDFQLKYCQFMINQQPNQSIITQIIASLASKPLNFRQRSQFDQIKQIINKKVEMLNSNIFSGLLELQNVLISENLFDGIEQKLKQYLYKNISLWSIFSENQLNISIIKKIFSSSFKLIKEIDRSWEYLSKYFCIHKRWKYLFINYNLYIKNVKMKQKELEEFGQFMSVDKLFNEQKISFDSHATKEEILQKKYILFDSETSVFHACMEHQELFIRRVSQYFTNNFKYQSSEIMGTNLSRLLPADLQDIHMEKVVHWIQSGYEVNEQSYEIKHSVCIDKFGSEIPVLKCFKTFINYFNQELQYVCLLKVNIKKMQTCQRKIRFTILEQNCNESQDDSKVADLINFDKEAITRLGQENNIFIKDDCYQPVEELKQLRNIKCLVRLYALIMTLTVIILALLNYQSSNALITYSLEYINFMQTYRLPMILANDYYKSILQIGNQSLLQNHIKVNTELLRSIQTNSLTMQTLFDPEINVPATFAPLVANQVNQNASYNQIEIYFMISSSITTLSASAQIDATSSDFQMFHDYLRPGYDNMLNSTKSRFHQIFKSDISNIYESIFAAVYFQAGALLFFLLISVYKVITFFQRIKSIVTNIAEFKSADMSIIYHYWCKIFLIFEKLIFKNNYIEKQQMHMYKELRKKEFKMKDLDYLKDKTHQNVNLNRKQKIIKFNKEASRFKFKIFLLILLAMIVSFCFVIAIETNFIQQFSSIIKFQSDGFAFLQYFPAATIVSFGCLQKSFAALFPNHTSFKPVNYDDVLSDLWLVGNFNYIGTIQDPSSLYYTKQRKYFFQNPCEYNPSVASAAGLTQSQCQTIAGSSFTRGLTSFMRYAFSESYNCINNDVYMEADQLDDFSKSVSLLSAYILDAIVTWGQQFNFRITSLISSFFQSNIIEVILIIGIHLLIFELIILKELKKEYRFYRLLYLNMVPQYILIKDKVIKQKFMTNKIIETNR